MTGWIIASRTFRAGAAAALLAGVCILSPAAWAGVQSIDVLADITGDSPADAQQKATDYAQKRAFFLLLSKLAPEKAATIAKSLSDQQVLSNIRGYEVIQDKLDGNRYIANYRVSVSEDMIERLLTKDTPQADAGDPSHILLLPVYTDEHQHTMLWEPENMWRSMVNSTALERGEGLLLVPYGDPIDMQAADAATILSSSYDALKQMADRYGAQEIVIAHAQVQPNATPAALKISLRRLGSHFDKTKDLYMEAQSDTDSAESIFPGAAQAMTEQLKEIARYYRGDQEKRIADAKQLKVQASFRRLSDWVQMQQSLAKLPRVIKLQVDQISVQSAQATLFYDGTPEAMMQIMQANGLHVSTQGDVLMLAM